MSSGKDLNKRSIGKPKEKILRYSLKAKDFAPHPPIHWHKVFLSVSEDFAMPMNGAFWLMPVDERAQFAMRSGTLFRVDDYYSYMVFKYKLDGQTIEVVYDYNEQVISVENRIAEQADSLEKLNDSTQ